MAFLSIDDVYQAYADASSEALQWRKDYPEFERLANNGLLDGLDENLPEVNDGSLAASLFKLAKRVIKKKLGGQAVALNRDEAWITKLANIYWEKKILPNARSKAKPRAKWKDAVRKAAIYGGQPVITLFLTRGNYTGSDFIVPYAQDVKLEAGKDSDEDSDIIFWDVYYSKLQLENMIEQAKNEQTTNDGYNKWDIPVLEDILNSQPAEDRPGNEDAKEKRDKGVKKSGYHFYIAFQRGVEAPFYMCHKKKVVREWSNPDPTGDLPVHYLYCYQDFINPYGIGIVKLAGGTQNVLDYMRQSDVLATQLGLRPPKQIQGDENQVDEESLVYAQDANWYVGNAKVERMELANEVYTQLPGRINMYQTSLQKMIPTGDTSISGSTSGDPTQSKTPAGVKQAAANLSIDDEDFSENVDETYAAVARSMINVQFANMQGTDIMKLTDDERDELVKSGLAFPVDKLGKPMGNELNIIWDHSRAEFDFEIDPSTDSNTTPEEQIAIVQEVLKTVTPQTNYYLAQDGWKFNMGEAYYGLLKNIGLENFNDIITKMTDEEKTVAQKQPFPIIDPPQIRLTGQIPTQAMGYALQQGGVTVPPGTPMADDQVDVGDILRYGTPTPNERNQILGLAGIQADPVDPNAQQEAEPANQPKLPSESLSYKDAPEDIKRQIEAQAGLQPSTMQSPVQDSIDQKDAEIQIKAHQAAHGQNMAEAQHAQTVKSSDQQFEASQQEKKTDKKSKAKEGSKKEETQDATETPAPQDSSSANLQAVMQHYNIDQATAMAMLEAEKQGYSPKEIQDGLKRHMQGAKAWAAMIQSSILAWVAA